MDVLGAGQNAKVANHKCNRAAYISFGLLSAMYCVMRMMSCLITLVFAEHPFDVVINTKYNKRYQQQFKKPSLFYYINNTDT